jgi:hypothetical protein
MCVSQLYEMLNKNLFEAITSFLLHFEATQQMTVQAGDIQMVNYSRVQAWGVAASVWGYKNARWL